MNDDLDWTDALAYALKRGFKVCLTPAYRNGDVLVSVYIPVDVWKNPDGWDEIVLEFSAPLFAPFITLSQFQTHLAKYPEKSQS